MIDLAIYFLLSIFISFLIYKIFSFRVKVSKLRVESLQAELNYLGIKSKLDQCLNEKQDFQSSDAEAFNKFISQSRDWAFSYIEDVQNKILKLKTDLENDVKFFNKFSEITSEYPHHEAMKKFVEHYKHLTSLLPEDKND